MLRPLLIAIQFLTRFPLPHSILKEQDYRPEQLGRSILMYPLVGLLIGGLLYGTYNLLGLYLPGLSTLVTAAVILFLWVLITGALHLDGLADSADAWVGGYGDRQRTLDIMKDPYCGPAGVTVLVLILISKFAVLTTLTYKSSLGLVFAPMLARSCVPLLFLTTAYVRKDGIGGQHASAMPRLAAWMVLVAVLAISAYALQLKMIWLILVILLVFISLRHLMIKRIGGTTGDTAGAMIEVMELLVLLVLLFI